MANLSQAQRCDAGLLYDPYVPELVADRDETIKKVYAYNHIYPLKRQERTAALHELLGQVGENAVIEQPLFCTYGFNTKVGDNFFMNINGKLMDSGKITIGNNVFIGPNVSLITETHPQNVAQRLAGLEYAHPITLEDNVWLCTNVSVLPGVTIGKNSVIGAGSIVTKDVPANCLAVGNPCRVIRTAAPEDRA